MRKFAIAAVAVLAIAGSTAVYAQHRHWGYGHSRMNPEDRAAFADARIAAVHAGLRLTAEQEKLWPPVEAAVRDFAKLRIDRANARMNASRDDSSQKPDDPVTRLRDHADSRDEEDRRCGRPALQDAGRQPEAPAFRPDPHGSLVRPGRLAAP
jgi:hypothetical protein